MHHFYDPQKAETWKPAARAAVLLGIQPSTHVNRIRRTYTHAGTITRHLKQLAQENGISLRTLYRLESTRDANSATLLYVRSRFIPMPVFRVIIMCSISLSATKSK